MEARYYPEIFQPADVAAARAIILTDEGAGADTDTRWEKETPYVLELVLQSLPITAETVVLDYGCGIGRIAKTLISATGCSVVGVDISASMRHMAAEYVGSDRFVAVSPGQYDMLVAAGLRVGAAIAVWVLQHCLAPADDIARIGRGLAGPAFVLNMPGRAIPVVVQGGPAPAFHWATDQQDVAALLRAAFTVRAEGVPDRSRTPNMSDTGAFWMALSGAAA